MTPTLRFKSTVVNDDLTTNRPHKPLTKITFSLDFIPLGRHAP